MDRLTSAKMQPGETLEFIATNAPFKLTLKISDGTEVNVDMHPGSKLSVLVGTSSIDAFINDPDRPAGHLEEVTTEPPSDD